MGLLPVLSILALAICHGLLCEAKKINLKINLGGNAVAGFIAEEEVLNFNDEFAKMRFHGKIKGHADDAAIFKTQRFSRNEDLVINIPVPDGIYSVQMLFAETWDGAYGGGKRVFDVRLTRIVYGPLLLLYSCFRY